VCQVCKAPITDEGNSDVKPDTEHGVLLVIALVQWPFSRITRLRCYQNVSTLLTRFFEAKDDGGGSNNWRYKMCLCTSYSASWLSTISSEIITLNKSTSNFLQCRCPSHCWINSVNALKEKVITFHRLAHPKLTLESSNLIFDHKRFMVWGGLPNLSSALWCHYQ